MAGEATIVAISVDDPEDSVRFASKLGLTFPLLFDAGLAVSLAYGVAMDGADIPVPATFVVRRDHTIAYRYIGETQADFTGLSEVREALGL